MASLLIREIKMMINGDQMIIIANILHPDHVPATVLNALLK